MEQLKEFVLKHFKVITVVLTFVLTMYIQHLNNTRQIEELINKCELLDEKIADQYERIDAIKLDKAVGSQNQRPSSGCKTSVGGCCANQRSNP